jgi:predicted ribosomally synthesized peptide with SipW-like signal peptide
MVGGCGTGDGGPPAVVETARSVKTAETPAGLFAGSGDQKKGRIIMMPKKANREKQFRRGGAQVNTRYGVLGSVVTLLLCLVLITGGTYAWFSDEVRNTGNRIEAGNLRVQFLAGNDQNFTGEALAGALPPAKEDADGYVDLRSNQNALFQFENWQPGDSETKYFKISNAGSMPLRYQVRFTSGGSETLAQVMEVTLEKVSGGGDAAVTAVDAAGQVPAVIAGDKLGQYQLQNTEMPVAGEDIYRVTVTFGDAGNEVNAPEGTTYDYTLDVVLTATQVNT